MKKNLFKLFILLAVIIVSVVNCPAPSGIGETDNTVNLRSVFNVDVPPEQGSFFKYISDTETGINGDISCLRVLSVNGAVYKNKLYAMFLVENFNESKTVKMKHIYVRKMNCAGVWEDTDKNKPILNLGADKSVFYLNPFRLIVCKEYLYAVWGESPEDQSMVIRVSRYSEENGWESVDGNDTLGISENYQCYFDPRSIHVFNNELYIVWYQLGNPECVIMKKFDGNAWSKVPTNEFVVEKSSINWYSYHSFALSEYSGKLCMAYIYTKDGYYRKLRVSSYDEQTKKWTLIVKDCLNENSESCASRIFLHNYNQKLYIAWKESTAKEGQGPWFDSGPHKIFVKQYEGGINGNTWIYTGKNPVFTETPDLPILLESTCGLHILAYEATKLVLKKYDQSTSMWNTTAILSNKINCQEYTSEFVVWPNPNVFPYSAIAADNAIYLLWHRYIGERVGDESPNKYIFAAKGSY